MPLRQMYFDPTTASPSNYHWIPWLQKQLLLKGVVAQAPEMPTPYAPEFDAWRETLERFRVDEATTLVGWSGGGGFLVRWLSEWPDAHVRKIVLVAPWINPEREVNPDRAGTGAFFDFALSAKLKSAANDIVIFSSDNDGDNIKESVRQILEVVPTARHQVFHFGHFGHWDMPVAEFPALLDEVLDE
jgi:predicted alpha/beta hydrolase family esterase